MTIAQARAFTLKVDDVELRTFAAEPLAAQAQSVLQTVAGLKDTSRGIAPGTTIDFGGALFVIAQEGEVLQVCEPDYTAAGHGQLSSDISRSLVTLVRQLELLGAVDVPPTPCSFRQSFTAPRQLDWDKKLYLQRDASSNSDESGWFIGSADPDAPPTPDDPSAYQKAPLYALFSLRPAAMSALLLPVGYIAVVDGDRVVGVADDNDNEVWSADSTPQP